MVCQCDFFRTTRLASADHRELLDKPRPALRNSQGRQLATHIRLDEVPMGHVMPQKPLPSLTERFERRSLQSYQVLTSDSPERFLLGMVDAKVMQCMTALHHLWTLAKITTGDEVQARWSRLAHAATEASSVTGTAIMTGA